MIPIRIQIINNKQKRAAQWVARFLRLWGSWLDGETTETRIIKETNFFINPQNVEDNERRCNSCEYW